MANAVVMPKAGITVESCIIGKWLKKVGDPVAVGDILFTYETDKAAFECESTAAGELLEIFFQDGDEVPCLTNVCAVGTKGEDVSALRPGTAAAPAAPAESTPAPAASAPAAAPAADSAPKAPAKTIDSPLVGTFYRAPSPDSPPFVKVGDRVSPDTVVCIVEAMKVMNEVKAETSGVIKDILCTDGTAVEYGLPLFVIE